MRRRESPVVLESDAGIVEALHLIFLGEFIDRLDRFPIAQELRVLLQLYAQMLRSKAGEILYRVMEGRDRPGAQWRGLPTLLDPLAVQVADIREPLNCQRIKRLRHYNSRGSSCA